MLLIPGRKHHPAGRLDVVSVFRGQKGRPDLSADPYATKLDVLTQFCPDQQYQQIISDILFQNVSLEVSLKAAEMFLVFMEKKGEKSDTISCLIYYLLRPFRKCSG